MEKRWILAALAILSGGAVAVAWPSAPPLARYVLIGMMLSIWMAVMLAFRRKTKN